MCEQDWARTFAGDGHHLRSYIPFALGDRVQAHHDKTPRLQQTLRARGKHHRTPANVADLCDPRQSLSLADQEELDAGPFRERVDDVPARVERKVDDRVLRLALEELWYESAENAEPSSAARPVDQPAPLREPPFIRPVDHLVQIAVRAAEERPSGRCRTHRGHADAVGGDGEVRRVKCQVLGLGRA